MKTTTFNMSTSELPLATFALCVLSAAFYYWFRQTTSSSTKSSNTPHIQTFHKYIDAYSTLRPAALIATATNTFTHTVLPASLNLPVRTLDPFKQHSAMIFSLFKEFRMIPQPPSVHFSRDTNTVIAHCKMGGSVNADSGMGMTLLAQGIKEWWTECMLFVEMDGSGRRVVGVREFVDSAKAEELKRRLTGVLES
jgi:hypothetical protein